MTAPLTTDQAWGLEALPVPALTVDPDGRIVASNRLFDTLVDRADPPGFRTWWEFTSACGVDAVTARSVLLAGRTPLEVHLSLDGRTWPCEALTAAHDDRRVVLLWPGAARPARDARSRESPYSSARGKAGLGLAGVYRVLKQLVGGVNVDSQPQEGTTFHPSPPHAGGPDVDADAATITSPHTGGTILIVDDDRAIRRVLTKALERSGYTVLEATGGNEGLQLLERHGEDIDLVVLDVIMPDISGWAVLAAMQERSIHPPVIVQSGFMMEMDDAAAQAKAFLRKPYELDQFLDTVRRVLGAPTEGNTSP